MNPRDREQGQTLYELMIAVVVLAIFAGAVFPMIDTAQEADRADRHEQASLSEGRACLDRIATDLRRARDVTATDSGYDVTHADGMVSYRWSEGRLRRADQSSSRVLTHHLDALSLDVGEVTTGVRLTFSGAGPAEGRTWRTQVSRRASR